jgi:hypothetical protein
LIDEIDVVIVAADAPQAFGNRAHDFERHLEVGFGERDFYQLTRLRIVIDR